MTDIENNVVIPAAYCPGNDPHSIAQGLYQHYAYTLAQGEDAHIPSYLYEALALLVRDRDVVNIVRVPSMTSRPDRLALLWLYGPLDASGECFAVTSG